MSVEQSLDRLEGELRQLRVEYERFFNGALDTPPEPLYAKIKRELARLHGRDLKSVADRFRLSNLEAKLATYGELFGRRLRDHEEGRQRVSAPAARAVAERGIVCGESAEPEAAAALYDVLARSGSGPKFDLHTFQLYLDRQLTAIRAKTGCRQVRFRVIDDGGQMKLKAKPVT